MKKLFLSAAFLLFITCGYSQLFNAGIKLGYNSSLSFNSLKSGVEYNSQDFFQEFGGNLHFGVFGRLNFGKVYVQPELLYSMQRKDFTVTLDDVRNTTDPDNISYKNLLKVRTIDVPILLGYKLLDLKLMNLRVFAGPKFRFNAGSKLDFSNNSHDFDLDDLTNDFKAAKVGLEAGLGVDVLMLTFDVRYNLIGNLYETKLNNVGDALKGIPASNILFTLGWKIL